MTRRLRVVAATAEDLPTCLLCDQPCHVVEETAEELVTWDLCASCDGVFQLTAARVAAAAPLVITGPAAQVLEHVAGQLEMEDPQPYVEVRRCSNCGQRCEDQAAARCDECQALLDSIVARRRQ